MRQLALPLLAIALLSSGCASVISGPTKTVQIDSPIPGSSASIVNASGARVVSGPLPMTAELARGSGYFKAQGYQVKVSSPGYHTKLFDIRPRLNPWYLANGLFPFVGAIGAFIVDPNTGAFYTFQEDQFDVDLEPTGQDVEAMRREVLVIKRAASFKVSKHDYTGAQRAKALGCMQLATPEVKNLGEAAETLIYECRDGRTVAMVCRSGMGCQ